MNNDNWFIWYKATGPKQPFTIYMYIIHGSFMSLQVMRMVILGTTLDVSTSYPHIRALSQDSSLVRRNSGDHIKCHIPIFRRLWMLPRASQQHLVRPMPVTTSLTISPLQTTYYTFECHGLSDTWRVHRPHLFQVAAYDNGPVTVDCRCQPQETDVPASP